MTDITPAVTPKSIHHHPGSPSIQPSQTREIKSFANLYPLSCRWLLSKAKAKPKCLLLPDGELLEVDEGEADKAVVAEVEVVQPGVLIAETMSEGETAVTEIFKTARDLQLVCH